VGQLIDYQQELKVDELRLPKNKVLRALGFSAVSRSFLLNEIHEKGRSSYEKNNNSTVCIAKY